MKILIADDSLTVRKIVIRYLQKHGYTEVDEAVNGQEAIEFLEKSTYICLFLDINMPIMDGFSVLAWLLQQNPKKEMHVVVMSTEVMQFTPQKIIDLGIHTVIPKPFTGNEFEKTAISLLNVISSGTESFNFVYDGPILIIDDSLSMRSIIRKQLTNLNCMNVDEATNGKEGFEKISELAMLHEGYDKIGTVFLDLIMPVMDGLELIELLEEKGLLSKLQIILLSGSIEMAQDMIDGTSILAALPKPFEHSAFIEALKPLVQSNDKIESFDPVPMVLFFDAHQVDSSNIDLLSMTTQDPEEFLEILFAPVESIILGTSFPKKEAREIPSDIFNTLRESVYRPVLSLDAHIHTYPALEQMHTTLERIHQCQSALSALDKEAIHAYFKNNILIKTQPYIELHTKAHRLKIAIKTLKERKRAVGDKFKTSPSLELKALYEKVINDLTSYRNALAGQETAITEFIQASELEFITEVTQRIEDELSRISTTSNQIRAAFDHALWEGMRDSLRYQTYCNSHGRHIELSTQSWLEHEVKDPPAETKAFLEKDFCTSILIIGFNNSNGVIIREELKKYFPLFNIQSFSYWSIKNYALSYAPSLLIINRESQDFITGQYVQEITQRFEIYQSAVNTLIIYEGSIKSEELLAHNSLYNLKRKNYMNFPKNSREFGLMHLKIKSLIF